MTAFEVYQKYVGIKLHFNSEKFDFVKSKGTKGSSLESYNRRRDKFFFEKLSKELQTKDIVPFFVAQFLECNSSWIGDMTDNFNDCLSIYRKWLGSRRSITNNVNEDIKLIQEFLNDREILVLDLFTITHGITHPLILRFYLEGMINIETMIYLDNEHNFIGFFQEELYDPISEHHLLIIKKYKSFLKVDIKINHKLVDYDKDLLV